MSYLIKPLLLFPLIIPMFSAQAAIVIEFNELASSFSTQAITVSDVGGTPTTSQISSEDPFAFTGTLATTGSLVVTPEAGAAEFNEANDPITYTAWSIDGSANLTIPSGTTIGSGANGWGVIGGAIATSSSTPQLLALTFDTSSLGLTAGQSLRLDSFTISSVPEFDNGDSALNYIIDGVSDTVIEPTSGTNFVVNSAINDGDRFAWTAFTQDTTAGNQAFSLESITVSVVPEPSSSLLILTGGLLGLFVRRRR